jgi:hypothetical protein
MIVVITNVREPLTILPDQYEPLRPLVMAIKCVPSWR